jgi:DNA primase
MDVIALAAAGIGEAVAPLGTALTERQIEMMWRLVDCPVLCFDGDAAGQRAAMRAVSRALPLLRPAHSLRIARLPAGLDPDDLIKRDGPQAMEAMLGGARDLIDVVWEHERDAAPLNTPEDKAGLKARLMAQIETIADGDIKALYRRDLLDRYSAFAFPRREAAPARGARMPFRSPGTGSAQKSLARGVRRDALVSAVIAGFLRFPAELSHHAEALGSAPDLDPRLLALVDAAELHQPRESAALTTILGNRGLTPPVAADYASLRFGFLAGDVPADQARSELAQAVALLVERPALEAALKEATARFEQDLSDGAYAEQQRLLKRKLEFDARLRQMASARMAAPLEAATNKMAE